MPNGAATADTDEPKFQWLLFPHGTAERHVADATVHLAVVRQTQAADQAESGLSIPDAWLLLFRSGSPTSEAALQFVESRLHAFNDTHVDRVSRRLKLTTQTTPVKIELDLMKLVPESEWIAFSHRVIQHGRRICGARSPRCGDCTIGRWCPSRFKV